jgi:glutamyl-tRNA reductase
VRAGRRARSETAIGASPGAFVEAGAALAEEVLGSLAGKHLILVGAGGMSEVAAATLAPKGLGKVTVLNRTPARAERLAERHAGEVAAMEKLERAVAAADLVVSSTGASGVVIHRATVERAARERHGRPLFLLDLAVPRDVDPAVRGLEGVTVADIDDLRGPLEREDGDAVAAVGRIVAEEAARFATWRRTTRLAPLIAALHDKGERIRAGELRRAEARLAEMSPDEREAVEALTRAIVTKLLHDPVAAVKDPADPSGDRARALALLFGLDPPPSR